MDELGKAVLYGTYRIGAGCGPQLKIIHKRIPAVFLGLYTHLGRELSRVPLSVRLFLRGSTLRLGCFLEARR